MRLKKTKLPKNKKITFSAIVGVVLLAVLLTFVSRLTQRDGLVFSCVNGSFDSLHLTPPPAMCAACVPTCLGHVETYVGSQLICNSTGGTFGGSYVIVPCGKIKDFIGKNATVNYWVNSSDSYFEGNVVVPIEYKK